MTRRVAHADQKPGEMSPACYDLCDEHGRGGFALPSVLVSAGARKAPLLKRLAKLRELLFQVGDFFLQGRDFVFQAGEALGVR
jgi:hypothetical protein